MTHTNPLFDPLVLGDLVLPNRILMAPLTRNRSNSDGTPKEMAQTYYAQRASAGLIISEATQISAMGKGYLDTPGIYTTEQVTGWRKITDAVHAAGGRIYCQLWHVGRISHTSLLPEGRSPLSSTDEAANAQTFTANGFEDCSPPDAMTKTQIKETIDDYVLAARCAKDARFDGIEVHSANGYLLDQFLQDGVNKRDDSYGGSIENRMRFLTEVLDAVSEVWAPGRIGVRLSPLGQANDISDSDPYALFSAVYDMLGQRKLAYLHAIEAFPGNKSSDAEKEMMAKLRDEYKGVFIGNGGYDAKRAASAIESARVDAVTFGRPFIANPDLPMRVLLDAEMNDPDQGTFYGGDEKGYIDYPFLKNQ